MCVLSTPQVYTGCIRGCNAQDRPVEVAGITNSLPPRSLNALEGKSSQSAAEEFRLHEQPAYAMSGGDDPGQQFGRLVHELVEREARHVLQFSSGLEVLLHKLHGV